MTTMTANDLKNEQGRAQANKVAMVFLFVSFSMLFATLFLGYAVFRLTATDWPPTNLQALPLAGPFVSTICVGLSSLCYFLSQKNKAYSQLLMHLSTLFCALFLGTQFTLWSDLKELGIFANTGIFGSIIYGFTWIHAAHMVMALISLLWVDFRMIFKGAKELDTLTGKNVGSFLHFLGVIWLIMFVTIFLI